MEHKWHTNSSHDEAVTINGRIVIDSDVQENANKTWGMEFKCNVSILQIQFRIDAPWRKRYSEWMDVTTKGETINFEIPSKGFHAVNRSNESWDFHHDTAIFISDNDCYKIAASTNIYCTSDCLMFLMLPKLLICPLLQLLINEAKEEHLYFYPELKKKLCLLM